MEKKGEIKEGVYPLFTPLSRSESIRCKTSKEDASKFPLGEKCEKWKNERKNTIKV